MTSTRSVGVDFGTTTSLVSEGVAGRQPVVFPLGRATTWLPSLVGLDADDEMRCGDHATDLPLNRVKRSVKRCITRNETTVSLGDGTALDADAGIRGMLAAVAIEARVGGLEPLCRDNPPRVPSDVDGCSAPAPAHARG